MRRLMSVGLKSMAVGWILFTQWLLESKMRRLMSIVLDDLAVGWIPLCCGFRNSTGASQDTPGGKFDVTGRAFNICSTWYHKSDVTC
jgi:hypothetical protein